MTYLAVPIAAKTPEEAKRQIAAAVAAGAEMLELRTDYFVQLSVALVRRVIAEVDTLAANLPVIVTCRDHHHGGALRHSNELRTTVLASAIRAGVEFVDVEYKNFQSEAVAENLWIALDSGSQTRLILSAHNFQHKFRNIIDAYRSIAAAREGAIAKLVYSAHHINDCFDAFDVLHSTGREAIVFCMDEAGLISRILAKKLNGLVTFGCIDKQTLTAPGQLTVDELRGLYRWDSIDAETELYGVIGWPVAHSLSPAIHNACFADIGANKLYLPLAVAGGGEQFNEFMDNALSRAWLGFKGFSVTIPHKQNALNYVKEKGGFVEALAERIGAVNTVTVDEDGNLGAYNTDYSGALDAITAGMGIKRSGLKKLPVAVVGAGGVARAIVAGLADAKARVTIYNRTVEKGEKLAGEFKCKFAGLDELARLKAKLLINCTSLGMDPDVETTAVPKEVLKKDMAVFDTVYNPAETRLLKDAKEAGARTISGLDMFVNQAAAQFKLFTGRDANTEIMRSAISSKLLSIY